MKPKLCILFVLITGVISNKYSENMQLKKDILNNDKLFRSNKLNLIWQKAKKRMDKDSLANFFRDMEKQDKLEMKFKKIKVEGQDPDGDIEADTRQKFINLMRKYNLADIVDDRTMNQVPGADNRKNLDDLKPRKAFDGVDSKLPPKFENDRNLHTAYDSGAFSDIRLNKIWQKAQTGGFTAEELEKLRTELTHQQEKMEEYHILKNTVQNLATSDNSVHTDDNLTPDKEDFRKNKHDLKRKYTELKENYEILEEYVDRSTEDPEAGPSPFTEPRVQGLWRMAQKANFSNTELLQFKEELKHFERKLEKRAFHQAELQRQAEKREHLPQGHQVHERVEHLEKKVNDYDQMIQKTHKDLKYRVHTALKYKNEL